MRFSNCTCHPFGSYQNQFYQINVKIMSILLESVSFFLPNSPQWARASSFTRFLDHTRRTTVGRSPLDEWSAHRRDLHLTRHNTHNRQTSMLLAGFEPTISAGEGSQTYALDRVVAGTGSVKFYKLIKQWTSLVIPIFKKFPWVINAFVRLWDYFNFCTTNLGPYLAENTFCVHY